MQASKLELVLVDLLEGAEDEGRADVVRRRDAALRQSAAWAIHRPLLVALLAGLKKEIGTDSGKTAAIQTSNRLHDDAGRALIGYAEAVLDDPGASAAAKAAAGTVLADVISGRSELVLSHADEIANARRRKPIIAAREAELRLIPAADGRTGFDLATTLTAAAEARAGLLSERAAEVTPPPGDGTAHRRALSGLLDFRRTLQAELRSNAALPAELEALVFGLFDQQRG